MFVIGILGGVASGKTVVAETLRSLGAAVLDADRLGHEALREHEVKEAIRKQWGERVINADGEVDRPTLGRIVFAPAPEGPVELERLEMITHPRIGEKIDEQIRQLSQEGRTAVTLDAAVLLKSGWDRKCDKLLFVDAPASLRKQRAARRGWDADEVERREAAQTPIEEKRSRADVIIDNSGDLSETRRQIEAFWNQNVRP